MLSEFWDMARIGHPLLFTIVRDGWALYDTGFFIPVRKLLELGKIPTTLEAVEKFMETAPQKINRVETAKLYMVAEDLYYSMLNSSQAVLMYMGLNPPSPKHTPLDVKEHLVDANLLEANYHQDLEAVIQFRKQVEHKETKDISGQQLDEFIQKAKQYVSRMEQLLLQLQKKKKETIVHKNYEVMIKAAVAALKKIDKLPPDPKDCHAQNVESRPPPAGLSQLPSARDCWFLKAQQNQCLDRSFDLLVMPIADNYKSLKSPGTVGIQDYCENL